MSFERQSTFRSVKWLAAVREIECCVLCGKYGTQAAHINQGKGIGKKVDDCLTAALCPHCHHEIDNGRLLSREDRISLLNDAVVKTLKILVKNGKVGVLHD